MVGIKMKKNYLQAVIYLLCSWHWNTKSEKSHFRQFLQECIHFRLDLQQNCSKYSCWILKEHPDDFDLVEWVLFDEHTELVYAIEVNAHNKGI